MKTMLKHTKILMAVLVAFAFALSTNGFSVYLHYCTSSNFENVSIIIPAEKCDHKSNDVHNDSCCETVEVDTCCSTKTAEEEKDCCHDQQEFKKLETDTVISQEPEIKALNTLIIEMLYSSTLLTNNVTSQKQSLLILDSPPPPDKQEFLAQIQVYLI